MPAKSLFWNDGAKEQWPLVFRVTDIRKNWLSVKWDIFPIGVFEKWYGTNEAVFNVYVSGNMEPLCSKARQGKFIYIAPFNTRQFKVIYKNGRHYENLKSVIKKKR